MERRHASRALSQPRRQQRSSPQAHQRELIPIDPVHVEICRSVLILHEPSHKGAKKGRLKKTEYPLYAVYNNTRNTHTLKYRLIFSPFFIFSVPPSLSKTVPLSTRSTELRSKCVRENHAQEEEQRVKAKASPKKKAKKAAPKGEEVRLEKIVIEVQVWGCSSARAPSSKRCWGIILLR